MGETDLHTILRLLKPRLDRRQYVFCFLDRETAVRLTEVFIASVRERNGVTVVLEREAALSLKLSPSARSWALITLEVHSHLEAVGLLSAVTFELAQAGISVNVFSGVNHDHLLVPWDDRQRALSLLKSIQRRF